MLAREHAVDPKNLEVWLSPSAGKVSYPLFAFDGKSLQEVAVEQLLTAGVSQANIQTSTIYTTTSAQYFSHSEFLKGNSRFDGRFGVIAILT